MLEKGEGL